MRPRWHPSARLAPRPVLECEAGRRSRRRALRGVSQQEPGAEAGGGGALACPVPRLAATPHP